MVKRPALSLVLLTLVWAAPARAYELADVVNLARDLAISSVAMARGVESWPPPYAPVKPKAWQLAQDAQRFYDSIKDGASGGRVRDGYKRVMAKFYHFETTFRPVHQQVNDPNAASAFQSVRFHYCALRGLIYPGAQSGSDDYDECGGN
jgi:hypothetical protein